MCEDAREEDEVARTLRILDLAECTGNVSEVCRRSGISRTQFYRLRKRYVSGGKAGLARRPPVARSHPQTTSAAIVSRIEELAVLHPSAGCDRLSQMLAASAIQVSGVTVQKYLDQAGLATRRLRTLALEHKVLSEPMAPSPEQVAQIEKFNPAFRERENSFERPGELLIQDAMRIARVGEIGALYLHSVVDCFTQQAFGLISRSRTAEAAVTLLFERVLPFHEQQEIAIKCISSSRRREYWGGLTHPYGLFLLLNDVRQTQSNRPSGYSERFHLTVRRQFLSKSLVRSGSGISLEDLQARFDAWLDRYNSDDDGFHAGFPNRSQNPRRRLLAWKQLSQVQPGEL